MRSPLKKNSRSDESGQGVLEYVLILTFAVTTSLFIARGIRTALDSGVLLFGAELERDLKTGRTPASAWKN